MGCGYGFARFAMTHVLSVFFSNGVEIVNQDNIPDDGPLILVGPHFNQFVDAMVMLKAAGKRRPGFIIAEKSMHRPVIGDFAKMLNSVPVIRPQDKAVPGSGTILDLDMTERVIRGSDTKFTKDCAQKGCQVSIKGVGQFVVDEVVSDVELRFKQPLEDAELTPDAFETGASFKVVPKISQDEVFEAVYQRLLSNGSIAIFPEGGSHDRTDLLPLKAGVTLMALGAAARGAKVKICAVGINYFSAHVFRSNAFADISRPIEPSPELIERFTNGDKRAACGELLEEIRVALNSVTMHAPNYDTLKAVRTARRMYQNGVELNTKDYLRLNNRFMQANEIWQEKNDPVYHHLLNDIHLYLKYCWVQGLTDKQVRDLPPLGTFKTLAIAWLEIFKTFFIVLFVLPLALPGLILNLPIPLRVNCVVRREMAKALAGSSVKIAARDVAASQKVIVGATLVATLMILYTVLGLVLMFVFWPFKEVEGKPPAHEFFAENAWWIAPLVFLIVFPLYTFFFVVRVGGSVSRRIRHLPALFICVASVCKSTRKNPAEALRQDRKRLVLRVQEFVENNLDAIPGWADDRIISQDMIAKRRSDDTLKLMESGDLMPHLTDSESSISLPMTSSAATRKEA